MELIKDTNILYDMSRDVDVLGRNKEVRDTVVKIKNAIRENNLTACSAVQLGIQWEFTDKIGEKEVTEKFSPRIMCMNFGGKIKTYINPIFTKSKGFTFSFEKCHSLEEDKTYVLPRVSDVTLTYQTPLGKIETDHLLGYAACVAQHQIDHMNGALIDFIGLEITEEFYNMSDEEKDKLLCEYLDSLDIRKEDIVKDIEADDELKNTYKAIEFITKVNSGEVKLAPREDIEEDD